MDCKHVHLCKKKIQRWKDLLTPAHLLKTLQTLLQLSRVSRESLSLPNFVFMCWMNIYLSIYAKGEMQHKYYLHNFTEKSQSMPDLY